MKQLTIIIPTLLCAALLFADGIPVQSQSAAQNGAVVAPAVQGGPRPTTRRRRQSRPSGGLLERREAIPSRPFGVVNAQKTVDAATVAGLVRRCRISSNIPLALDVDNAPAVVRLEETDGFLGFMSVYPEAFCAVVNVKALAADGASKEVVAERLRKELIRAALFVLGSGYSPSPCLARPVSNLEELDRLNVPILSPETMTHLKAMPKLGIHEIRFATYYQACREGWAPAPTNDVQKTIWEQVKADKERGPTNPITIQPPNAKK